MKLQTLTDSGLCSALLGNVAAFLSSLVLLRHRYGEAIRPMDLPLYWIGICTLTMIASVPTGWNYFRKNTEPLALYGLLAIVFSLTPLLSALAGLTIMIRLMGFELKE